MLGLVNLRVQKAATPESVDRRPGIMLSCRSVGHTSSPAQTQIQDGFFIGAPAVATLSLKGEMLGPY